MPLAADDTSPASPGMGTALSIAVRGALLRCADDFSSVQDQLDCAQLLRVAGLASGAQSIRHVASMRMGFSSAWPPDRSAAQHPRRSLDIAVAQLAGLFGGVADLPPLPPTGAEVTEAYAFALAAPSPRAAPRPDETFLTTAAELCELLLEGLRHPSVAQPLGTLGGTLAQLRETFLGRPAFEARNHAGAELSRLCAGIASDNLRHFLWANVGLAYGPFGSAGLLHAAARLDASGLGPFLTGTANLLRDSRDVFGLIRLAGGSTDWDTTERWAFLLSLHLPEDVLHDLVQDLADLGFMRAIWGIHAAAASRDVVPLGVFRAIRDAGLDEADFDLALRAQRSLVRWQHDSISEWVALGDVEATAGNWREAETALEACLRLRPEHPAALLRLRALRAGQYGPYFVKGGFGTPNSRRLVRLRRREARSAGQVA